MFKCVCVCVCPVGCGACPAAELLLAACTSDFGECVSHPGVCWTPVSHLCVCSRRWRSGRRVDGRQRPRLRPGHAEPPLPTEERHVCVERRRRRTALEGPRQCSAGLRRRPPQDGRAASDWLHPFWRSVARLRSALQRLPAAVFPSPEGRKQPLPSGGGLRAPPHAPPPPRFQPCRDWTVCRCFVRPNELNFTSLAGCHDDTPRVVVLETSLLCKKLAVKFRVS